MAISTAIIPITTSSSTSVKPAERRHERDIKQSPLEPITKRRNRIADAAEMHPCPLGLTKVTLPFSRRTYEPVLRTGRDRCSLQTAKSGDLIDGHSAID